MHDEPSPYSTYKVFGVPMKLEILNSTGTRIFMTTTPRQRTAYAKNDFISYIEEQAAEVDRLGLTSMKSFWTLVITPHPDTIGMETSGIPKNWNPWINQHNDFDDMQERCSYVSYYMGQKSKLKVVCRHFYHGDIHIDGNN
jgi:hypothetical protein